MMICQIKTKDPYLAWQQLISRYKPSTIDAYTKLNQDLECCVMSDPANNPEPWLCQLSALNARLGDIDPKYQKDEIQMILHILNKLSNDLYRVFMTMYQVHGYSTTTLTEFQMKLRDLLE